MLESLDSVSKLRKVLKVLKRFETNCDGLESVERLRACLKMFVFEVLNGFKKFQFTGQIHLSLPPPSPSVPLQAVEEKLTPVTKSQAVEQVAQKDGKSKIPILSEDENFYNTFNYNMKKVHKNVQEALKEYYGKLTEDKIGNAAEIKSLMECVIQAKGNELPQQ